MQVILTEVQGEGRGAAVEHTAAFVFAETLQKRVCEHEHHGRGAGSVVLILLLFVFAETARLKGLRS